MYCSFFSILHTFSTDCAGDKCFVSVMGLNTFILALLYFHLQDSESQSKVVGPEPQYLDEFTSLLVPDDTRVMVDLLKLAVSCRSGEKGKEVLSAVLSGMGTAYPQVICILFVQFHGDFVIQKQSAGNLLLGSLWVQVADMLLELCVTELEDVATDSQSGRLSSQPVVVESSHPYTDDTSTSGTVKIPGEKMEKRGILKFDTGLMVLPRQELE